VSGRRTRSQPLYRQLVDDLTRKMSSGVWAAGDKLPSERSLCDQYEVSQITVRRALRELAALGRVYSHHGLGWFVSDRPANSGPTPDVLLVLPDLTGFLSLLARHLVQHLQGAGQSVRLVFTEGDLRFESVVLRDAGASGIGAALVVLVGDERELHAHYGELLPQLDLPLLFALREVPGVGVAATILDEREGMRVTARHLLALGHRRVAYVGSDPARIEGWQRYQGFCDALWAQGLEIPLDWVFSGSLDEGPELARFRSAFASLRPPTALVCASDRSAAQALRALRATGLRCPEDVAVVGLDDDDYAQWLSPALTTFRFDIAALSRTAVEMTLAVRSGRRVQSVRVAGGLVLRESCGAQA